MDRSNIIECGGFFFIHNFDSGNLGHVERVPTEFIAPTINPKTNVAETPDYEFNLWTRPDCAGTEFENGNRTWFYFGIQASEPNVQVRLNLINLNKQGKMYNQGMAPVTRTLPGKPQWERIRDRPVHSTANLCGTVRISNLMPTTFATPHKPSKLPSTYISLRYRSIFRRCQERNRRMFRMSGGGNTDDNTFTLTFRYRTAENPKATTFFAFTYPFSFAELQIALNSIDLKMLPLPTPQSADDIYYCRECLIYSLEGRRVDLLTISSNHGITTEREERLKNLFPDNQERPFKFNNKKIIFISARVHPGETPSSFVFNGFLNLLLTRNDPIAIQLRRLYVFKMIPFLNPDGVARGHYRTDTRGVNLNRVYLNPSLAHHPTVYASRALIRYYHYGQEKEEDICEENKSYTSRSIQNISESTELVETKKKKNLSSPSCKSDSFNKQREKGKAGNKSSIILKEVSVDSCRDVQSLSGDAANLADQVYDMKLQEMPSQTSDISSNVEETASLLNDNVLRSCLGSTVHLSTSEELNLQGSNPLKPLRETLKNSISLLMESSSSALDMRHPPPSNSHRHSTTPHKSSKSLSTEGSGPESKGPASKVKIGWCRECRQAVARLEDTMPGITSLVPGYSAAMMCSEPPTYHSIEEYRDHQRQQIHEQETKLNDMEYNEKGDNIYFCTNCFKRYIISEKNEEIKLSGAAEASSRASLGVSAGDGSDVRAPPATRSPAPSIGDSLIAQPSLPKDEKPKAGKDKPAKKKPPPLAPAPLPPRATHKDAESGLYLYIDLHGHASKKGIFMYGNHFEDLESCVECMLLPRIMSLNNLHFHFSSCNFTERNMYLKDRRDGMSREGSGRVAVLKATGLVRSYTLECNYNTGRLVNVLPPTAREGPAAQVPATPMPPKYTPHIFEEVGRSLGASILDLTGQHPNSRIPCSEHRNLTAVRDWLRAHTRTMRPQLTMSRLRPKTASPPRAPLYARSKAKVTDERKENAYVAAKNDSERKRSPPVLAQRSGHELVNMNMKFAKKNEPVKSTSRTRYLAENEPKPKTLSTKRRNILSIRKPNASKTQTSGIVKAKANRRAADDSENPRTSLVSAKLSKRSFSRSIRVASRVNSSRCRAMASSSSDDVIGGGWEDVSGGTALGESSLAAKRRPFSNTSPSRLKKIRLKSGL